MWQEDHHLMAKAILSHPSKARPRRCTAGNLSHLSAKGMLDKKHGSHKSRVATKIGSHKSMGCHKDWSQWIGSKSY